VRSRWPFFRTRDTPNAIGLWRETFLGFASEFSGRPLLQISSRAVRVTHPELAPEAIAAMFRAARPPVIGRIADDAFLLDVRAVDDASVFAVSFPGTRS
jgi:L-seryl-tRNA selenium transferase